jgi:hypothetical protein
MEAGELCPNWETFHRIRSYEWPQTFVAVL